MHHTYLIAISTLFLLVFAVMLHSLIAHRRQQSESAESANGAEGSHAGDAARRFYGPTGTVQWLWATVPLAILALVSFALLRSADESDSAAMVQKPGKTALVAVANHAETRK